MSLIGIWPSARVVLSNLPIPAPRWTTLKAFIQIVITLPYALRASRRRFSDPSSILTCAGFSNLFKRVDLLIWAAQPAFSRTSYKSADFRQRGLRLIKRRHNGVSSITGSRLQARRLKRLTIFQRLSAWSRLQIFWNILPPHSKRYIVSGRFWSRINLRL